MSNDTLLPQPRDLKTNVKTDREIAQELANRAGETIVMRDQYGREVLRAEPQKKDA